MKSYQLRQFNDPALKVVCRYVTPDDEIINLLHAMKIVILKYNGIGLAAPQIGSNLRVIIVGRQSKNGNVFMAMVNPKIEKQSQQSCFADEGCLSYPGVIVRVKRSKRVRVSCVDGLSRIKLSLSGHTARVFQHEFDHLNGICLVGDEWRRKVVNESRKVLPEGSADG